MSLHCCFPHMLLSSRRFFKHLHPRREKERMGDTPKPRFTQACKPIGDSNTTRNSRSSRLRSPNRLLSPPLMLIVPIFAIWLATCHGLSAGSDTGDVCDAYAAEDELLPFVWVLHSALFPRAN